MVQIQTKTASTRIRLKVGVIFSIAPMTETMKMISVSAYILTINNNYVNRENLKAACVTWRIIIIRGIQCNKRRGEQLASKSNGHTY